MDRKPPTPRNQRGFTLIELLTTLAIGVSLSLMAVSAYQDFLRDNVLHTSVSRFVHHLRLARSSALQQGLRVTLCPSSDGLQCSGEATWHAGWIGFANQRHTGTLDPDEDRLWVEKPPRSSLRIISSRRSRPRPVVFQPIGMPLGYNARFTFCDRDGHARPRTVVLANSGRIRIEESSAEELEGYCRLP